MMKNKKKNKEFSIQQDHQYDLYLSKSRSAKLAWIVAGISMFLVALLAGALALLAPLKRVEPYVLRVDNVTGHIEHVTRLKDEPLSANETLNKYFVGDYVRTRESYLFETADTDFKKVLLLSTPKRAQDWKEYFNPNINENSPVKIYGDKFDIEVTIKSISLIKEKTAQVRFRKRITSRIEGNTILKDYIATVNFDYFKAPATEDYRQINPLGFQVHQYRLDEDNLGEK